jgi:hypothetical protein
MAPAQVAYNGEKCVRLYKLPSFQTRGFLVPVSYPFNAH